MNPKINSVPKAVIKSVGIGLFLMAFFTIMWSITATVGFTENIYYLFTGLFSISSLLFIIYGIHLFHISGKFPKLLSDADKTKGKKIGKWYGIIFGLEGLTIPLTAVLLSRFNADEYLVPAIALIVGLHFYPMAKVFKRTIDYYLATWTCIIGLIGIYMTTKALSPSYILAFVGVGVAISTTAYGFYMIYIGQLYKKSLDKL